MDPLTILGAVSGAIKLLDSSIKVSSHTYLAIKALKNVTADVRTLKTSKPLPCSPVNVVKLVNFNTYRNRGGGATDERASDMCC
jgi:hypothetical protein